LIAAALLAVVCLEAVAFARRVSGRQPFTGIEWIAGSAGPTVFAVEHGSPGDVAALEAGDVVEKVAERPVRSVEAVLSALWDADPARGVALEIRRGSRRLTTVLHPAQREAAHPLYGYLALTGLAFLVSGAFVAVRWPTVRGGTVYSLFAAAVSLQLVLSHTGDADVFDWVVYWGDVVAGCLAPSLLLHFCIVLSRRTLRSRGLALSLAYAPGGALLSWAVWLIGLRGYRRVAMRVLAIESLDRLQVLFLAGATVAAMVLLLRSINRTASALHRGQLKWILWGTAVGFGPLMTVYGVPWALGATPPPAADLAAIPLLVVPAAFTVALARYRLHDLSLVLRRAVSEITAAIFTLAVYALALEVLRRFASGALPLSRGALRYVAILVAAISYPQLRAWVRYGFDRAFYRSRYSYRATLLDWVRDLSAETDLVAFVDSLESRVRATLGIPEARVLVRKEDGRFADALDRPGVGAAAWPPDYVALLERGQLLVLEKPVSENLDWVRFAFPMRVKDRLAAVLAVADREGASEPLTSEDRSLLATLSVHAAAAIEAARLMGEVREHAARIERLKASQERILESSGVGLLLMDADGRILAWNRTLEEIYGLGRSGAIGQTLADVFPLHLVRRVSRELQGLTADREARIYRYALVNRAGRRIVVNLTLSPAGASPDGDGARVLTFDDVTQQVKLEEQILQQERLASLGLLAAGVAHEVNTPLTGISSYTQMLLEEMPPDDPRYAILRKIESQSRRASSIANTLLHLARPGQGTMEQLSINAIVRETLALFEPQIRSRSIVLDADLSDEIPPVLGDRAKLQQVLLNLLLNARDAVEDGGRIQIVTRFRDDRVLLDVIDDGVGISDDDLPRIFDPFFTTKTRGKGTGLGLSISYGIVHEHGGEIRADSSPGEATRFRVELPVSRAAEALA
jgi:hypothetical protein